MENLNVKILKRDNQSSKKKTIIGIFKFCLY